MKNYIPYFLIVILTAFCIYIYLSKGEKNAYVNLSVINAEFEMKKDLEKKYNETVSARTKILDSLKLEVIMLQKLVEKSNDKDQFYKYNVKKENYLYKENEFENDNANLSEKLSGEVWKQLNEYVEEYGKAYGYDYIFGAAGNGSLMFANSGNDITEDVVKYINLKYNDKK
ncbi:MAG: hypothetical protein CVU05_01935 [Bacteroidetes bacterium HGW-Bacteroidetes-21]|jgi:Skp family chaperone for outer membrane proteins|nr:MAG: hypothetical protein CVU05_01935 [Bacteroidetes bacterium HGW-Bacteroidetes-21]